MGSALAGMHGPATHGSLSSVCGAAAQKPACKATQATATKPPECAHQSDFWPDADSKTSICERCKLMST